MSRIRDLSLSRKIKTIILFSTALALILSSFAFLWLSWNSLRDSLEYDAIGLARAIGDNATAALLFKDASSAHEIILALASDPRVLDAALWEKEGTRIAIYSRDTARIPHIPSLPPPEDAYFEKDALVVVRNIIMDNEHVGSIFLRMGLASLQSLFNRIFAIIALIIGAMLLFTYFLASKLQALVSKPVLDLAQTVKSISSEKNYGIRAVKTGSDEVGDLIDGFNAMLEQIQNRDEALRRHSQKLALRSAEVTAVNAQLNIAIQKAEQANRAKSDFLAKMSHEFRTPLNAIIGYCELIKEEATETEDAAYIADLDRIHTSARHLLALINDVLDISKIEAGKMEVFVERFDVGDILKEVYGTVCEQVEKNGNVLEFDYPEDLGSMMSDSMKLKQILLNLLGNSGKFTQNGHVSLNAGRIARNGVPWLQFQVKDTGIGIRHEDQKKLFQAFSQVDDSTSRKYGGTGLGLAITQRFVQMLGGTIHLESEPGRGSTFEICLPAEVSVTTQPNPEFAVAEA
ncbi:MAG: ATP-binding protein [Acidobacteriota bacterium]|nr:ATP-binding protein [Acidobacteriota bacterium]